MKLRLCFALLVGMVSTYANAQEQYFSTVDVTANILEIAYDRKLTGTLGNSNIVAGVRGSNPAGGSWVVMFGYSYGEHYDVLWAKMNKTVNCGGQEVSDFIVLPIQLSAMPSNYAASYPGVAWIAGPDNNDSYFRIKELFSAAYLNNHQVKFTRVLCGSPQLHPIKNQLVPVAYIQGQKYFTVVPKQADSGSNNSAWINGVQVTPTNSQPTNAVVTNWNFTVPAAGSYDVYVHWVSNKNQVANIAYAVDGQALKSASLDQNISAGIWTKLIKNTQYAAGEHSIKVSVDANANYVIDGVRAEKSAP